MRGDLDEDRRLTELLSGAFGLPPDQQERYLAGRCDDAALIERALELLQSEISGDRFTPTPADLVAGALAALPDDIGEEFLNGPATAVVNDLRQALEWDLGAEEVKGSIGPYTVERLLGEGGMGRVYLASQSEPVQRHVALKLLRFNIVSPESEARFAAERQALARLSHPNIAQMFEAGTTEAGTPFFAMEVVLGEPITDYCNERQLSIAERLRIVIDVCRGVQHAHQKQVLHRDLKPSNILVAYIDGRAVPKVIDFGVAKALDEPLTDRTLETGARLIGTPAYASPESLVLRNDATADLDTRNDIYSLGILLYELLCGGRPFDEVNTPIPEIWRRIIEDDARPPSAQLAQFEGERVRTIAAERAVSPAHLRRRLAGDLDWIVLKAIAKNRENRYGSISELASDLERHLDHQPTIARPPTAMYLAGRFVQRNKGKVASVLLLVLSLIGGLVARGIETKRANNEAVRARAALAASEQLTESMVSLFGVADPSRAPDEPVTTREMMDVAADRILDMQELEPRNKARLLHRLGNIYKTLMEFDRAEALLSEAVSIRTRTLDDHDPELIESLGQLGDVYRSQERLEEAEEVLQKSLALAGMATPRDARAEARAWTAMAALRSHQGRSEEALNARVNAIEIYETEPDARLDAVGRVTAMNDLGSQYISMGRYGEADRWLADAAEISKDALGEAHPLYATALINLATTEDFRGNLDAADALRQQFLEIRTRAYGPDHPRTLEAHRVIADSWRWRGHYREAISELERVLVAQESTNEPQLAQMAGTLSGLGVAQAVAGDFADAEASLERALQIRRSVLGADHPEALQLEEKLGWVAYLNGRHDEAESRLQLALAGHVRVLGRKHPATAFVLHSLGLVAGAQGNYEEARVLFLEAISIREQLLGPRHRRTADTMLELGMLARRHSDVREARNLLSQALEIYSEKLPPEHPDIQRLRSAVNTLDALSK